MEVNSQCGHLKVWRRAARWRDLCARQLLRLAVRYGHRLHCIVRSLVSGEVKLKCDKMVMLVNLSLAEGPAYTVTLGSLWSMCF